MATDWNDVDYNDYEYDDDDNQYSSSHQHSDFNVNTGNSSHHKIISDQTSESRNQRRNRSNRKSQFGEIAALDQEKIYQEEFYQKLIKLLVLSGYFRAAIPALTRFDKVIGGLSWAITASQVSVDASENVIQFVENPDIGQQVVIGQQIVRALKSMQCPHLLTVHQIWGLDFANIYPVMRWLVTKVIEIRATTGDLVRKAAISEFNNTLSLPQQSLALQVTPVYFLAFTF